MIELHDLTKRYGDKLAVNGLTFQVPRGSSPASSAPTAPASRRPCG